MPVSARTPLPRRPPEKSPRRSPAVYPRKTDTIGPALVVTLLFHILLFQGVKHSGFFVAAPGNPVPETPAQPIAVQTGPTDKPIPANLLPAQMRPSPPRFFEVNPMAPSLRPEKTVNTEAADQRCRPARNRI